MIICKIKNEQIVKVNISLNVPLIANEPSAHAQVLLVEKPNLHTDRNVVK